MEECISLLREPLILSILKANCINWELEIGDNDHFKTAFTLRTTRLSCMPSGLRNALGTFRSTREVIVSPARTTVPLGVFTRNHFFSTCRWKHQTFFLALSLLNRAVFYLGLKQPLCFTEEIEFLGPVIGPSQSELESHAPGTLGDLEPPRKVMELKSFFGLWIVCRRFAPKICSNCCLTVLQAEKLETQTIGQLMDWGSGGLSYITPEPDSRRSARTDSMERHFDGRHKHMWPTSLMFDDGGSARKNQEVAGILYRESLATQIKITTQPIMNAML